MNKNDEFKVLKSNVHLLALAILRCLYTSYELYSLMLYNNIGTIPNDNKFNFDFEDNRINVVNILNSTIIDLVIYNITTLIYISRINLRCCLKK